MTFLEFLDQTPWLGYVLGVVLVTVGAAVLVTLALSHPGGHRADLE